MAMKLNGEKMPCCIEMQLLLGFDESGEPSSSKIRSPSALSGL